MKISIIGSGNIATFVATKLYANGHRIHQIVSERVARAKELAQQVQAQVVVQLSGIDPDVDALFVAIPDDELKTINLKITTVVVHCSGTCTLQDISHISENAACLWPVYSITKENLPYYKDIPIVINGNTDKAKDIVAKLANNLSTHVYNLTDEQKQYAHLSATISNNFSNHLFTIAHNICLENNIDFNILIPILELTIQKLKIQSPANNQTGPALRGDETTMAQHKLLLPKVAYKEMYNLMSKLIGDYYKK